MISYATQDLSDRLGGFWLSRVYDDRLLKIWVFFILIDWGLVNLLMWWPEGHFHRDRYASFAFGDLLLLPTAAVLAAWVLQNTSHHFGGWYTERWYNLAILGTGFAISAFMEITGSFNWRQEVSPSKLWHTVIFGLMFYWLMIMLVPLLVVLFGRDASGLAKAAIVAALALGAWHLTLGSRDAKAPMTDQHLESHYRFPDVWNSEFTVRK